VKTHCKHGHPYTAQNTRWAIDKSHGRRYRKCLDCRADGERLRNQKRALAKNGHYGPIVTAPADLYLSGQYYMELEFWQRRHAAKMQIVRRQLSAMRERRPTLREMISYMSPREA